VVAEAFDLLNQKMYNVTVIAYDDAERPAMYMQCAQMEWHPLEGTWHVMGGADIVPADGGAKIHAEEIWPDDVPQIKYSPEDINAKSNKDPSIFSMSEIKRLLERNKTSHDLNDKEARNYEFQYWNKISVGLAAFVFGTLGAVLGIRSQRTSAASGFAMAVGIIFGYFVLANFMNVWAEGGILPAWAASFAPIVIGLICSGVIMWRRNS
jgi:lipopolysaccharide export system permease protein